MEEKARVLIVDDNFNRCKTMAFVLRRKGFAVTTAKVGLEAIIREEEFTKMHLSYDKTF